jgi:hypothetical protein
VPDKPIEVFVHFGGIYDRLPDEKIQVTDGFVVEWQPDEEKPYIVERVVFNRNENRVFYSGWYE